MFSVTRALEARSHDVIPFSVRYSRNLPTPYSEYFVDPLAGEDEVTFREQQRTPGSLWRTLSRLFYAPDVELAVTRLIEDTKPDIAYVLHYLRKLSPSLLIGLKKSGLPVVVRLSDYAMLCPQAHCLRDSEPCDLCTTGNLWPSVWFRCVQSSLPVSVLNMLATWYYRHRCFFDLIDVFVLTNRFMYDMMVSAGFSRERLRLIPTFTDVDTFRPAKRAGNRGYWAYAGRLTHIKGVRVFIEALSILRRRRPDSLPLVKIAGSGDPDYVAGLKQMVSDRDLEGYVELLGELDKEGIADLLSGASLSVVPSLWYENLPNAILESYACGTPVIASRLGSLCECVQEGKTGYLFDAGNAAFLAESLECCLDNPQRLVQMGENARQLAVSAHSADVHLNSLEALFRELL